MAKALQQLFLESEGKPVHIGDWVVKQADLIPIKRGLLTIRFKEGAPMDRGIRLKAKGGWIERSDGRHAEVVDTWRVPGLPDEISYKVSCPRGSLMTWNIYRVRHYDGTITEDMWTGNAGLVLLSEQPHKRIYGCSPGGCGGFEPQDLVIELEWKECSGE